MMYFLLGLRGYEALFFMKHTKPDSMTSQFFSTHIFSYGLLVHVGSSEMCQSDDVVIKPVFVHHCESFLGQL